MSRIMKLVTWCERDFLRSCALWILVAITWQLGGLRRRERYTSHPHLLPRLPVWCYQHFI